MRVMVHDGVPAAVARQPSNDIALRRTGLGTSQVMHRRQMGGRCRVTRISRRRHQNLMGYVRS